jgi:tetratricopeptide (TPR) repeat protein
MQTTTPRRLSRRQRGLLRTAILVAAAALVTLAIVARNSRQRQTAEYHPGESNADITQSLARDLPRDAPKPVFVDVTREAGLGDFVTFQGARTSQLPEDMGPGAAWGDFDNDGDDDLLLVSAGGPLDAPDERLAPTLLFENLGNGRFRRVGDFPEPRIVGMGAAWGDYDGDGWIDLVITGYDALLLYHNDRGHLTRDARFPSRKGFWATPAWGDYDNDGRLDLYVCGYVKYTPASERRGEASQQYGAVVPYTLNPASYEPERNLLFHNLGRGGFPEIGAKLGVSNLQGRSLSAVWHDFDQDGWPDLYVANDISDNVLFRNVNGRFEDISHPAWVADYRGAMGLAVGDWNRDGDDDLFISHWLAQENALYDSLLKDSKALRFADAADTFGLGQIALPMVGWGVAFLDFDSDGWLDLAVANGSTIETEQTPKALVPQAPFLFWNRHGEYFHDLAPLTKPLAEPRVARGLAVSDFDNDGDLDLLIASNGGGVRLLRNDTASGHWGELRLRAKRRGSDAATVATGAIATATVSGVQLRRAITGGSYLSQSTTMVHFGLGKATAIDALAIRWPDGLVSTYGPLGADRAWEIVEGDPAPREIQQQARRESAPVPLDDRARVVAFWDRERAAMHALKVEKNTSKAIGLFREALALDPDHEDSRYYLAACLTAEGNTEDALREYEQISRIDPRSHRALTAWGTLRALTARSDADLGAAENALARAHAINPEETGALLTLGEVALIRGHAKDAERHLSAACRTNARAAGGFFLLGYLRWKQGDVTGAKDALQRARAALGPDWKPSGSTAEGDVARALEQTATPLSRFLQAWDGTADAAAAYRPLDAYLTRSAT